MNAIRSMTRRAAAGLLVTTAMSGLAVASVAAQENETVQLAVKNHRFQPSEIRAPAGKRITLRIRNLDSTPMEFESVTLRVEKVVAGNGEGVINLRPLEPGRYKFFDDFNQSARGTLVVQ